MTRTKSAGHVVSLSHTAMSLDSSFSSDMRETTLNWTIRLQRIASDSIGVINHVFFKPRADAEIEQRREIILNALLAILSLTTFVRLILGLVGVRGLQLDSQPDSWLIFHSIYFGISLLLWKLSRMGYPKLASMGLLSLLTLIGLHLTLRWGFQLPISQLACASIIVVAGVLLNLTAALALSGGISLALLVISFGQVGHHLRPHTDWVYQDVRIGDALVYISLLGFLMLLSWYTSREMNEALKRAQASEAKLQKERESLEIKVRQRTRELTTEQLLRNAEQIRFEEFGRLSANLIHEIANPLTAVSLNLEQLDDYNSELVDRAKENVIELQRYVELARGQLHKTTHHDNFSLSDEITYVIGLMTPLAKKSALKISFDPVAELTLCGDSLRFHQVMCNLIANSIDAYIGVRRPTYKRLINVRLEKVAETIRISVHDNGAGIEPDELPHVFDNFYSTKADNGHNLGLGLANVRRIVEHDFKGNIAVTSDAQRGTTFTVTIPASDVQSTG